LAKKIYFLDQKQKIILYDLGGYYCLISRGGNFIFQLAGTASAKKEAALQAQKISQAAEAAKKNITWSLQSFFLTAPAGARAAFKVASDIEGFWRINDTSGVDKKMTILYVKNPDYAQPLLYIRYDNKTDFKLKEGETEMKTNSAKYSYAYYFYPVDSYPGADKAEFTSMQNDLKIRSPLLAHFNGL